MGFKAVSILTGLSMLSLASFAEPPIQAGDTIESLSKVKITTSVNGQPGSIQELLASGQIKLVSENDSTRQTQTIPDSQIQPAQTPQTEAAQNLQKSMNEIENGPAKLENSIVAEQPSADIEPQGNALEAPADNALPNSSLQAPEEPQLKPVTLDPAIGSESLETQ